MLTLKQLSEKTAFLVAFLTLSRYCLVSHWTKLAFYYSHFSLTVLLRVNSLLVLEIVVHEGVDGAAVKLLDLEKVKLIYTNLGCCYHLFKNGHSKINLAGLQQQCILSLILNKQFDRCYVKIIFVLMYIILNFVLMKIDN